MMAQIRDKIARFERNELTLFEARSAAASRQRIIRTTALSALCLFARRSARRLKHLQLRPRAPAAREA